MASEPRSEEGLTRAFAPEAWRVVVDEPCAAAEQMRRDVAAAAEGELRLRLFRWAPSGISLALKQTPPVWFDPVAWQRAGLECVERPTGGGVAFHGSDLSLSVIIPRRIKAPLALWMRLVCHCAVELCKSFGAPAQALLDVRGARVTYCLTQPSPYAVLIAGRKVAGYAIRRYPESWLIQASLLAEPVKPELERALPSRVLRDLAAKAIPLSEAAAGPLNAALVAGRAAAGWPGWWLEGLELHGQAKGKR